MQNQLFYAYNYRHIAHIVTHLRAVRIHIFYHCSDGERDTMKLSLDLEAETSS